MSVTSQALFTRGAGTLIIVRHGETEGQSSIRYHGRTDVALCEHGRAQMRAVACALAGVAFAKVFASNLCRATQSARIIAGDGAHVIEIEEFAEIDFGNFEGLTQEEIRVQQPAEFEQWQRGRLDASYQYPGGESRTAFNARVLAGIERMFEMWRNDRDEFSGTALLLAHRGVIRTVIQSLIDSEAAAGVSPDVADPAIELASIHILDCDRGWRARSLDMTGHLDGLV